MPNQIHGTQRRCTQCATGKARRRRWAAVSLAAGAVHFACAATWAGTDNWIGGSSDWNTPGNWDSNTVPLDGDTVNIINTDGTSPIIDYNYTGPAATLFSLTLDNSAGVETLSMQTAGLALTAAGEIIGNTGTAALFQAASLNTLTGSGAQLVLGSSAGSSGAYTLQDGTLALTGVSSVESIGAGGSGVFNQSGGMNSVTASASQELIGGLGQYIQTGGMNSVMMFNIQSGSYSLSQTGTLSVIASEDIDLGGTFNQSGGVNAARASILLGNQAASSGTYILSDGTLSAGFAEFVGFIGTGTFVQTGGSNTVSDLAIAFLTGGSGSYALGPAGSLTVTTSLLDGYLGTGTFTQTGGTATIGNSMYLGYSQNGLGIYNLSGGTLNSASEYIGNAGTGQFTQSDGVNSISKGNSLYLGYTPGATGSYLLTNTGTLNVLGGEFVGYGNTGPAAGAFTQSGGLNTLAGTSGNLSLGTSAGSNGSYNLIDGTLALVGTISSEIIGAYGTGSFVQTAGLNSVNGGGEIVGNFNGGNGYYELDGGVNNLAGPASNLYLGYSAGANGFYFLTGGTLSAANAFIGGSNASAGGTGSLVISGTGQVSIANGLTLYNTPGSNIIVDSGGLSAGVADLNNTVIINDGVVSFHKITGASQIIMNGGLLTLRPSGGQSQVASLVLNNGATVDLGNNNLAINYGSDDDPVVSVMAYLASGYKNGTWTGTGLTSSAAAADPYKFALWYVGSSDPGGTPNQVLVKYTLAGDVNLDGKVNFADFSVVVQNLYTVGQNWSGGNLTYDPAGYVNFADFSLVVQNFQAVLNTAGGLPTNIISLQPASAIQVQNTVPPIPEPASIGLLAAGAAGLLARRRKRRPSAEKY